VDRGAVVQPVVMSEYFKANGGKSQAVVGRFVGIVALYGLLGPMVGAVGVNSLFTVLAIGGEMTRGAFGDIGQLIVGGMVVGTIISLIVAYAIGIVPAAAVGFMVARRVRRENVISLRTALWSALVLGLLVSFAAMTVVPPDGRAQWIGALLVAHLLAAVVCTWVAQRVFGRG